MFEIRKPKYILADLMKHPVVQKQIEARVASFHQQQSAAAAVFVVGASKSRKALKKQVREI